MADSDQRLSARSEGPQQAAIDPPAPFLVEEALRRGEGLLSCSGALAVRTGKYTGRSPRDKFIVDEPAVHAAIDWGEVNHPLPEAAFEALRRRMLERLSADGQQFIFDGYACADPRYRISVRVITEYAWHSLFIRQLLLRPDCAYAGSADEAADLTVIVVPNFKADPERDGVRSETFIVVDLGRRTVLIGGTEYAGEIKKAVFTVLNFVLPERGVLPMHCSANCAPGGQDAALFFGLSGTGKTSLSVDATRELVGDDEHGWSDYGIFNCEGGCYAKCIGLDRQKEPQIWDAIRFGAVLENVVLDPATRAPLYDDAALTENTRAAYPLAFIPHARVPSVADHPRTIVLLTADAFGVLPPIARLTHDQAVYHFLSGYTSKLAGTERGVTEPEATFSPCFAQPFLPLPATVYASMLREKLSRWGVHCYLVNTGWTGGAYGVGRRIDIAQTRAMVAAALKGSLDAASTRPDPIFALQAPVHCPGVDDRSLNPRDTWESGDAYDRQARRLADLFGGNFRRFPDAPASVAISGPNGAA